MLKLIFIVAYSKSSYIFASTNNNNLKQTIMKNEFKQDTINFCLLIGMMVVSYFLVSNILLNA